MDTRGGVLLTGATGFLGRYLLRNLLSAGKRVAVLVRPTRTATCADRVEEVLEFAQSTVGTYLPQPTILAGDLRERDLGLSHADRVWLSRRCDSVVHAAACVSFRTSPDGEPHTTNVLATHRLVDLCARGGIRELHHVSTAFVCGQRLGPILESEVECGQTFHNEYEQSKLAAELAVRSARSIRSTIYRPSVIVGDSLTGYTGSYHGVYKFLELAHRLAQPGNEMGRRILPLRLPFAGDELRNLVPVDWVAEAITRIVGSIALHGRTYHLTNPQPATVRDIKEIAVEELQIDGVELVDRMADPNAIERAFLQGIADYFPYLTSDPVFNSRNTRTALPDLPCPQVDRERIRILVRFAIRDNWGRGKRKPTPRSALQCGDYLERYFPAAVTQSPLARIPLDTTLGFDIRGPGGGRWICRLSGGQVISVRDSAERPDVEYRMGVQTFAAVVSGRETPQTAFFNHQIEIAGNVEDGLKLALLFGEFVRDFPYSPCSQEEHDDATLPD